MNRRRLIIIIATFVMITALVIIICVLATGRNKNSNEAVSMTLDSVSAGKVRWSEEGANEHNGIDMSMPYAGITEDIDVVASEVAVGTEPETYWGYKNLGIASVENHLNIRESAGEDGKLIGKMSNGDACEILEVADGWAHVQSGEIEGYVATEYLLTGPAALVKAREIITPVATTTGDGVRVREEPNTECAVITQLPKGEELKVLEELDGGWVKLDLDDEEAYISAEYVDVAEKLSTGITLQELLYGQGVSDVRVDLCQYAKQFIGNPYVWGGTSLTNGCDCSGFVMSVYAHFGVSLPHYSRSQASCGTTVSLGNVKPGDLVFYTRGGSINHVAIYIGNGQVCHASSPKTGIKVSSMYYRTPYKAVSLLP